MVRAASVWVCCPDAMSFELFGGMGGDGPDCASGKEGRVGGLLLVFASGAGGSGIGSSRALADEVSGRT